ncbi:MAG: hypothetical protein BroJett040_13600 [Oligoflexia bacterium]|nr:MAG: hypothetical protein BroJett040_13600 [Oligoflexia bacterium]
MSNVKVVKRGDFIVKEGDKITNIILVQSGAATMCVSRPKKNIELVPVGPSQILGEQALLGAGTHPFSVVANTETKYMEIPVDAAKAQVESSSQFLKVLIKSVAERLKVAMNDLKSVRMEKDSSPLPEDQIAQVYGAIFFAADHKGEAQDEKNKSKITVDWTQMRQYAQRIFGQSPRRLEQAVSILVKMKIAEFQMGKSIDNPEGPDEIQKVHFLDLSAVEAFFEFYQYYYFKGGKSEILKYDEAAYNLLSNFIKLAEPLEVDRFGVVTMDFTKVIEAFKNDFGINLGTNHFTQLEAKGIFAKRQARSDGSVVLQFEIKEFKTTQKIWRLIREIDKWNEKGFVDMTEDESKPKKKPGVPSCTQCGAEVSAQAKFCQECGAKVVLENKPAA